MDLTIDYSCIICESAEIKKQIAQRFVSLKETGITDTDLCVITDINHWLFKAYITNQTRAKGTHPLTQAEIIKLCALLGIDIRVTIVQKDFETAKQKLIPLVKEIREKYGSGEPKEVFDNYLKIRRQRHAPRTAKEKQRRESFGERFIVGNAETTDCTTR